MDTLFKMYYIRLKFRKWTLIKDPPYEDMTSDGLVIWNKFWQSKSEDLILLSIDYFSLAAYCEEMALYYRCRQFVKKNGLFYYPNKARRK